MSLDQALENLKFEYEHLSQKSIPTLINCYALQACFKDPFQEVVGHIAITAIFEHMFTQLDHPTFLIRQTLVKDLDVALLWDFRFSLKRWNKRIKVNPFSSEKSIKLDMIIIENKIKGVVKNNFFVKKI